jgi:hypothetical protein
MRLLLAVPAALLLAACTGSGGSSPSSSAPAPGGMPTAAPALGALVKHAVADLRSAHLSVGLNLSAETLSGTGDEQLSDGRLAALDLTTNLAGAGAIRVVHVEGQTYAKLPTSMNPSGKPYLLVSSDSSNPTVHQLAPYLDAALTAVSPASLGVLAGAAQSVDVKGTQTVNGTPTTHYALVVDVTKVPPALLGTAATGHTLPLDLYVARDGRPAQADLHLNVQGQDVPIDVKFSDFNKQVSITPPPAGQVSR